MSDNPYKIAYERERQARLLAERLLDEKTALIESSLSEKELLMRHQSWLIDDLQRKKAELEEVQERLVQSAKMQSIGQLAAGIAHEINNPLGYIKSNIETLGQYVERFTELIEYFQQMTPSLSKTQQTALHEKWQALDIDFLHEDSTDMLSDCSDGLKRISEIIGELNAFSRQSSNDEYQMASLAHPINTAKHIFWTQHKSGVVVELELDKDIRIPMRESALVQVFLNFLLNAEHATRDTAVEAMIKVALYQKEDHVFCTFADNGCGMPQSVQAKIFDPFFTTKPVGEGTGLGLSVAYTILRQHGFELKIDSQPGEGTTFTLSRPLAINDTSQV